MSLALIEYRIIRYLARTRKSSIQMEGYIFVDFDTSASSDHKKPAIIFLRELHGPAMVGHYPWNKCLRFSIVICLLI